MWRLVFILPLLFLGAAPAWSESCDHPICLVDYNSLNLAEIITFETVASSAGPGRLYELLDGDGATFGERFAGQLRDIDGDHDIIRGLPFAPLTPIAGAENESLGVQRVFNNNVLIGFGPLQYPARRAAGEGAIAVAFDVDQSAIGFRLVGGEDGEATITFLRRDGSVIVSLALGPLGEDTYGFLRGNGARDIAGFVIDNQDPEGIAIDDLIFNEDVKLGRLYISPGLW